MGILTDKGFTNRAAVVTAAAALALASFSGCGRKEAAGRKLTPAEIALTTSQGSTIKQELCRRFGGTATVHKILAESSLKSALETVHLSSNHNGAVFLIKSGPSLGTLILHTSNDANITIARCLTLACIFYQEIGIIPTARAATAPGSIDSEFFVLTLPSLAAKQTSELLSPEFFEKIRGLQRGAPSNKDVPGDVFFQITSEGTLLK